MNPLALSGLPLDWAREERHTAVIKRLLREDDVLAFARKDMKTRYCEVVQELVQELKQERDAMLYAILTLYDISCIDENCIVDIIMSAFGDIINGRTLQQRRQNVKLSLDAICRDG